MARRPSFDMTIDETFVLSQEFHSRDSTLTPPILSRRDQFTSALQAPITYHQKMQQQQHQQNQTMSERQFQQQGGNNTAAYINWWSETKLFFELASVSCLTSLSAVTAPFLTTAFIGRQFPTVYLSAFTLANLTGNLSTFAILWGLLSAADTLGPQAYGTQQYSEVGRVAIRGAVICGVILVPINIGLVIGLEDILVDYLGQDREAAHYAHQWYRIFALSLPFAIVYNCLNKFLTAQHIMRPLIVVSITSTCLVLPVLLNTMITWYGFLGSAYAYVLFQCIQAALLLSYIVIGTPHNPQTWPVHFGSGGGGTKNTRTKLPTTTHTNTNNDTADRNTSTTQQDPIPIYEYFRSAIQWTAMKEFLHLGLGGVFAQCEWIFWEGIGLVVGQLGVVSLSVHAIPNQTIMTFCMIPFNFGIALAIRMGVSLPVSVRRTQSIVIATTVFSLVVFGIASLVCYYSQHTIVGVFTTDPEVRALADTVWTNVSLFNFNVAIFAIFAGIATGLGKQWLLGMINFGYLWLVGFPIIYYHAIYLDEGLTAVWYWMNVPYLLMNMTLAVCFVGLDWYHIQHQIITKNTTTPATAATTNNTTTNGNTNDENNTNNNDPRHEYSQTQADDCMDDETTTLL